MSTSPSWFDQEKFSRLVKKVGPKTVTEPLPNQVASNPENRTGEGMASTARISLVSKPPSLLTEQRALPALPRRTAPLPSIKAFFPTHANPPSAGMPAVEVSPESEEDKEENVHSGPRDEPFAEADALAETWQKMSLLNEELARAIHERDQALNEGQLLRDQLNEAVEALEEKLAVVSDDPAADLARVIEERDDALLELQTLREQMAKKAETGKELRSTSSTGELKLLTEERDQARRQYFEVRQEFENLKQGSTQTASLRSSSDKLAEELRVKLVEKDKEIGLLKQKAVSGPSGGSASNEEIVALREQLAKVKEDASVAQRGLTLSQKALHETRDTLREATEGTSLSRHNFDNLKNECATLSQQNAILQAKNDQLTKDLVAAKQKITSRL